MLAGKSRPIAVTFNPFAFQDRCHFETGRVKYAEAEYGSVRAECILCRGKVEIPIQFRPLSGFNESMNGKVIQIKADMKNDRNGDLYLFVEEWREV